MAIFVENSPRSRHRSTKHIKTSAILEESDFMARILVVDDDPVFGWLTQRRLQNVGHEVTLWNGPLGAFAELKKGQFDLLLVDLLMPGLSGADIVRMVRSRSGVPIKIILFSSLPEDDLAARARALDAEGGVDGFISKAELSRLVDVVSAALSRDAAAHS